MMVDQRAIDIGKWQAAQLGNGVVGVGNAGTHVVDQLAQSCFVHVIIVPDGWVRGLP